MLGNFSVEAIIKATGADKFKKDFESSAGSVGKFKEKAGKAVKVAGAAVIAGTAAMGASLVAVGMKATANADNIHKASQRIGVSTNAFQEMSYWADQNGVSQASMEKAVTRLHQQVSGAVTGNEKFAETFKDLGVSVKDASGEVKSTDDVMTDSIKKLSEIGDVSERTALATELFGKKLASELQPALADGALSMEDAAKTANEFGMVMDESAIDSGVAFTDAMSTIKTSLGGVMNVVGASVIPVMQKFADFIISNMPTIQKVIKTVFGVLSTVIGSLIDKIPALVGWVSNLIDGFKETKFFQTFADAVALIGEKVSGLFDSADTGGFSPFIDMVKLLGEALLSIDLVKVVESVSKFIEVFAPMLALIAGAVVAFKAYTAIMGVITTIKTVWAVVTGTLAVAQGALALAVSAVTAPLLIFIAIIAAVIAIGVLLWKNWDTIREFAGEVWGNVVEAIKTAWSGLAEWFSGLWDGIKEIFSGLGEWLSELWSGIVESFRNVWSTAVEWFFILWDGVKAFFTAYIEFYNGIWTAVIDLFRSAWETAVEWFFILWDGVKAFFTAYIEFYNGIWSAIIDFFRNVWSTVIEWFKGQWESVKETFSALKEFILSIWETVKTAVIGKVSELVQKVIETFSSLYDSVSGTFEDVKSAVVSIMQSAYDSVTEFFGKFKEAGANIVGNIADGITSGIGKAKEAVGNVAQGIRDFFPFSPVKDKSSPLVDIHKNGITDMVAKGIYSKGDSISTALKSVLGNVNDDVLLSGLDTGMADLQGSFRADITGDMSNGVKNQEVTHVSDNKDMYIKLDLLGRDIDYVAEKVEKSLDKKARRLKTKK